MAEIQESSAERSVPELVKDITAQSAALARKEIELAEADMIIKGKRAGLGAGMFGGAGVLGLFGLGALTAAAILGLAIVLPGWASALIVAGVYFGVAGVIALMGGVELRRAKPLPPTEAAESVKDDVEWIKAHAERGRQ
ncbi:MAG TPA: phage holin family protein [Solirubrobacteraceae bacterium]|nr:phage holin family protein [Solirubrobacteraceae bacterium]